MLRHAGSTPAAPTMKYHVFTDRATSFWVFPGHHPRASALAKSEQYDSVLIELPDDFVERFDAAKKEWDTVQSMIAEEDAVARDHYV